MAYVVPSLKEIEAMPSHLAVTHATYCTDSPSYNICSNPYYEWPVEYLIYHRVKCASKAEGPAAMVRSVGYFITLTRDPQIPIHIWLDAALDVLNSKTFLTLQCTVEHIQSNIHIHAWVTTKGNRQPSRDKFITFCNLSRNPVRAMDIRKIGVDNGVSGYLNKENPVFTCVGNLQQFILKAL